MLRVVVLGDLHVFVRLFVNCGVHRNIFDLFKFGFGTCFLILIMRPTYIKISSFRKIVEPSKTLYNIFKTDTKVSIESISFYIINISS